MESQKVEPTRAESGLVIARVGDRWLRVEVQVTER